MSTPPAGSDSQSLSLGEFLRQEREKTGVTLEQVASATKIGVKTLHALESDNYAELPAKPFVRGFVNSYARFIGLDAKDILTRYGDFLENKVQDRPMRDAGHSGYAFEKREGEQSRTILWAVLGTFTVAGLSAAVFIKRPHHGHGSHVEKLRAAHSPAPSPEISASPLPTVSASPSARPSEKDVAEATPVPSRKPSPTPSPTKVTPTPTPSPSASAPPKATPTPTPAVSPTPGTSPLPSPSPVAANPKDPLNSGVGLKLSEIKHKVLFKTLQDAWVRYQVDGRPVTKFVIRKGRVLVLRAEQTIRFQASPPEAITYSYNSSGYRPLVGGRTTVSRQEDATLFFPSQLADSIQEPFPGEHPLSKRSVPAPRAPQLESTNSP